MKTFFLLGLTLYSLFSFATAQDSTQPTATIKRMSSLTPSASASAVSSFFSALATVTPQQPGDPSAGDVSSTAGSGDSNAGAAGQDTGSIGLSKGVIIAIIVVACSVCLFGGKTQSALWKRGIMLMQCSCLSSAVLPREEEGLADSREYPEVGKTCRDSLNTEIKVNLS